MTDKDERSETVQVVVIGAGFAGLAAAKTYLQCAPATKLVVLDANQSLGGTWAKERLYPGIHTNNLLGTFEFPDFPFRLDHGAKEGEHISGTAVHNYLTDFCDVFNIARSIRLRSKAKTAGKLEDGRWRLEVDVTDPDKLSRHSYTLICTKLIVATGLTSEPESIYIAGQECFRAPIINTSQLPKEGVEITDQTPSDQRHITVLGGSKSAYDAVYMFASRGFEVNWIIRKSGHGPTWMAPARMGKGSKKTKTESVPSTRAFTWFSPCLLGRENSYISRFLHGTALGRTLVDTFWAGFGNDIIAQTGLNSHPELHKLIPEDSVYWYATSIAILNYETDIHDLIRDGTVRIYREDIAHLSPQRVNLVDGTQLPSPAGLVAATSWKHAPNIEIWPASLRADLGLPGVEYTPHQKDQWNRLNTKADKDIFDLFPKLAQGPSKCPPKATSDILQKQGVVCETTHDRHSGPYRLYRFLAPPMLTAKSSDRSIVFQGYMANLVNHTRNEISALWIYAYLNHKLDVLDSPERGQNQESIITDTALQSRYWKWRYPWGYGERFPDMGFEQVAYNDLLLTDLGLNWRRKRGWFAWVREFFEPYCVKDYRGLTQEWLEKNQ